MADIHNLKVIPRKLGDYSVLLRGLTVSPDILVLTAMRDAGCLLDSALRVLSDVAVNSTEDASDLYAVLTSASIAKALFEAAEAAILRREEVSHA